MFSTASAGAAKKKGKQATKGDTQIAKENAQTIESYKNTLAIGNVVFLAVHLVFYFITGLSYVSLGLFVVTSLVAWYVWSFMRQIGTAKSGGSVTDLNLEGSVSEYAKDIILVMTFTQSASLIHGYFWWFLIVIPIYAIYKGIMLFFFSPYAQLRGGGNQDQDADAEDKKPKKGFRVMGLLNILYINILMFAILFKHWFRGLVELFNGGPPLKDLTSEIVLITGGARGLGKGVAERLAPLGCTIVLWDVDEENNRRVAEELNTLTNSKRIHAMKCDLTNRENIYQCAEKVQQNIGHVTMVINNAGVVSGKQILDCSDASIQRTFDVNVIAHFWIIKAFLPAMLENNHGHIVTVASAAGLTGISYLVDYCSSKFAAVGLHEALTHELYALKKHGIKTTVVCPSFINTGMFSGVRTNDIAPLLKQNNVCDLIVKAIRQNQHMLLIPKELAISLVLSRLAPTAADLEIQELIGLHQSMNTFTGRQ